MIPWMMLCTPAASCDSMPCCRGIEGQLREEAPPRRRFAGMDLLGGLGGDAGDMDNRLMNLLEALEGRLNIHVSCAVCWPSYCLSRREAACLVMPAASRSCM